MKHYVNYSLLFFFLSLVITGVMRFFMPFDIVSTRIHIISGFAVTILVGLHLSSRLTYFKKILSKPKTGSKTPTPWKLLSLTVGSWIVIIAATLYSVFPINKVLDTSYESRNRAIIFRTDHDVASRPIDNGFVTKKATSEDSSLAIEIEWGEAFDADKAFGEIFSNAKPQIAIWAEGPNRELIETFFVSEESAFTENVKWDNNYYKRVNILPIWRHKYTLACGVEPNGKVDTYSGATPSHSFSVNDYLANGGKEFYIHVEVNLPHDENDYFNSDKSKDESGYNLGAIGQPSVIYSAYIDPLDAKNYYLLDYVGHGKDLISQDGEIDYDSSQITTAKQIIEKILLQVEFVQ